VVGLVAELLETFELMRDELRHKYILPFLRVFIIFSKEIFESTVVFVLIAAGEHNLAYFAELPRQQRSFPGSVWSQIGVPGCP
jgi:hypothetical protein